MKSVDKITYRITYTKGDEVKYISHLDFLRCINRAFKRAKLPVKYSQGFNPHIVQNIALPCPVGVMSECEMVDIDMTEKVEISDLVKRLGESMPRGIEILGAKLKEETDRDFFDIDSASYEIDFCAEAPIDPSAFDNEESFMIEKKSKRGMKEVNIKDFVKEMHTTKTGDDTYHIDAVLCAGATLNLKADLLLSAMSNYYGVGFKDIKIIRKTIMYK